MGKKPLISIVTACYNSEAYLEEAIKSVLNQTYRYYEHIIVDGHSTDRTVDIIRKYQSSYGEKLKWISEKDSGIYDAINKGIGMASGELIGLLHSDDWLDRKALEIFAENYEEGVDIYHGKLYKVREIEGDYYRQDSRAADLSQLKQEMSINHPSCYITREWYSSMIYDIDYRVSADYKFILKSYLKGARFKYIDYNFVFMRIGGSSSASYSGVMENYRIRKEVLGENDYSGFIKKLLTLLFFNTRRKLAEFLLPQGIAVSYKRRGWDRFAR